VLPHAADAVVDVYAEGRDPDHVDALLARFVAEVERAIEAD
jgi:hypothetical protein